MIRYTRLRWIQFFSAGEFLLLLLILPGATPVAIAQYGKPVITKIDPPSWFTRLPDSMLLVHGENLEHTTFTLRNTAARIVKAKTSANGHWAFLTLATATAQPGTFELTVANALGSATVSYTLSKLRGGNDAPKGFNAADVMYLILPDRFADGDTANDRIADFKAPDDRSDAHAYHGGDLRGIAEHLDYLQQLGVTTIWTTPLYDNSAAQSGSSYHGYAATDMYAVDPHFGSMADYQELVQAAHARGMKIVLDMVPNHVGPAHPWVKDSPTPDWFHGTAASHIRTQFDSSSIVNPNAPPEKRIAFLDGWFANVLPDLNQDDPLVATYLTQNAVWWIETAGIDGLRLDTFPFVPRSFWHTYNTQLHALYPHLSEVGEIFNKDPQITSFFAGGRINKGSDGSFDTDLDTPFDYPMYYALRDALTHRKPMTAIADVLRQDALYPHPERLVTFIGNHDNTRFLSEPGATTAGLHLAYGLLATLRGMPELYYGDEIGMKGLDDPDNRRDFPGGFPGDKTDAFTAAGRNAAQQQMEQWVQTLMRLRAETAALQTGEQKTLSADADTFVFVRGFKLSDSCSVNPADARYIVVVNNGTVPRVVRVPLESTAIAGCTRFESVLKNGVEGRAVAGALEVQMPGQEIGIFRAQQ